MKKVNNDGNQHVRFVRKSKFLLRDLFRQDEKRDQHRIVYREFRKLLIQLREYMEDKSQLIDRKKRNLHDFTTTVRLWEDKTPMFIEEEIKALKIDSKNGFLIYRTSNGWNLTGMTIDGHIIDESIKLIPNHLSHYRDALLEKLYDRKNNEQLSKVDPLHKLIVEYFGYYRPSVFISYSWPSEEYRDLDLFIQDTNNDHDIHKVAKDLECAGIRVLIDKKFLLCGDDLNRFINLIHNKDLDYVYVMGTPLYKIKYDKPNLFLGGEYNKTYVEAKEIIQSANNSLACDQRIVALLIDGDGSISVPAQLQRKIFCKFSENDYFNTFLRLIFSLYLYNEPMKDKNIKRMINEFNNKVRPNETSKVMLLNDATLDGAEEHSEIKTGLTQFRKHFLSSGKSNITFNNAFGLPREFPNFTGRNEVLDELETSISQINKENNIKVVVSGAGGVGKTQLALAFAYSKLKQYQDTLGEAGCRSIIWLLAGTDGGADNKRLMDQQFHDLGESLGFDPKQFKPDNVLIRQVFQRLEEHGPYLVVFDNANEYHSIEPYLPPSSVPAVITTQNSNRSDWDPSYKAVTLGVFSEAEALVYIKKYLSCNDPHLYHEKEAVALAKALCCFPLALTQALAYITTNNIRITEYLKAYAHEKKKFLEKSIPQGDSYLKNKNPSNEMYDPQTATVCAVIQLSLKKMINPDVHRILKACAYLASETPIDVKMLVHWAANSIDSSKVLESLRRYSLLENLSIANHVRIHQFVQEILRLEDTDKVKADCIADVVRVLAIHYDHIETPLSTEARQKALLPHLLVALEHAKGLNATGLGFDQEIAKLQFYLGELYELMGSLTRSLEYLKAALIIFESVNDEKFITKTLLIFGHVYYQLGKPTEAKLYYERAWIKCGGNLAPDSREYISALTGLGNVSLDLKNTKDAQDHYELAMTIEKRLNGDESFQVANLLTNIGNIAFQLDDFKRALNMFDRAIEILKKAFHEDHPEIASTLMSLGCIYYEYGNVKKAEKLFKRTLNLKEKAYGLEHYAIVKALRNLGSAKQALGEFECAKKLFERALAIAERAYGPEHTEVTGVLSDLGILLSQIGQEKDANEVFNRKQDIEHATYVFPESDHKTVSQSSRSSEKQKNTVDEVHGRHGLFSHKKTYSEEQIALFDQVIPKGYQLREAKGKGDCFYDSCAQELNERAGENEYTIKSLRLLCHQYAVELDKRCNANPQHPDNWISKALNHDLRKYQEYLANVQYTVEERETGEGLGDDKLAIWGEVHIDGRILCEQLRVKLHVIEMRENPDDETNETQKFILSHNLVNERGLRNVEEDKIDWKDEKLLHIAVCNLHFVPILRNTAKQTSASDLDIDQYNDTDHYDTSLDGTDKSREIKVGLTQLGEHSRNKSSLSASNEFTSTADNYVDGHNCPKPTLRADYSSQKSSSHTTQNSNTVSHTGTGSPRYFKASAHRDDETKFPSRGTTHEQSSVSFKFTQAIASVPGDIQPNRLNSLLDVAQHFAPPKLQTIQHRQPTDTVEQNSVVVIVRDNDSKSDRKLDYKNK